MSVTYLICRLHNMKQQMNSPFSCHHRKFATRLQTHQVLRISRQKSGGFVAPCPSLASRFGCAAGSNFLRHTSLGTFGAFFQNFGAAARAGIRNQGPAGSESRIRPAARPGIKNQGRCAARNQESRITAGGLSLDSRLPSDVSPHMRLPYIVCSVVY